MSNAGTSKFTANGSANTFGPSSAQIAFSGTSHAAQGIFVLNGAVAINCPSGELEFTGNSAADSASITCNGSAVNGAKGGSLTFYLSSSAGGATVNNQPGTSNGAFGGNTTFYGNSTAGNATLIANGGTGGGLGGTIYFSQFSTGGAATVKVFGNGILDITSELASTAGGGPNVTIGSFEGDGNVFLGKNRLTVSDFFTQASGGTLSIEIGGTANGQFGQIVTTTAALAGSLNVTLAPGFQPGTNDIFQIISSNSLSGTFNNGNPLIKIGTKYYSLTYTNNGVTMKPTAVIMFKHEPSGADSKFGHSFLSITSINGQMRTYGFYPVQNPIMGHGELVDDSYTIWDWAIIYPITLNQYNSIAKIIDQEVPLGQAPDFTLVGFNCTTWIASIAAFENIAIPNFRGIGGIPDPPAFGNSLSTLGSGTIFHGGIVVTGNFSFPPLSTSFLASGAPYDYSYNGLESSGFANGVALASSIGLNYDAVNLGTVNANNINGLSLSLIGTATTSALISVNWGDGSAYTEQSLTPSHVYAAGTYNAQILVIDNGAVHSYTMTVGVSSAPSTPVTVNVTAFPPVNIPNQGLLPAGPVPDFIVMQTTGFSVLPNGHGLIQFNGIPGWTYSIQAASDLISGFSTIGSATADTNGNFQFDDPAAIGATSRFYRATYP